MKNAARVLKTIHRTKSRRVQHVNEKLTIFLVVKSLKVKIVTYGHMSVSLKKLISIKNYNPNHWLRFINILCNGHIN